MYYYEIRFFERYEGHDVHIFAHEQDFNDTELSVMVYDCIDKAISEYAQENTYRTKPCEFNVDKHFLFLLTVRLRELYGFTYIAPIAKTHIEYGYIFRHDDLENPFLYNRYKDVVLSKCNKCKFKNHELTDCIVDNIRR